MSPDDGAVPRAELEQRWMRVRAGLFMQAPEAGGLLVFSRLNIYYLTGTFASGVLWLPREGEPVLLCRRGHERARRESPLATIMPFRSYRDLEGTLREAKAPLTATVCAEMNALSWALGQSLAAALPAVRFVPGNVALAQARAVKSPWELAILRSAGALHDRALRDLLPERIAPGMSEREVAHAIWELFFALGHQGMLRLESFGEEVFLGHVAAGENANYPSVYDGPVGLRGEHPAAPFMGHAGTHWRRGEPLIVDVGFTLCGYQTDLTQVYWAGPASGLPEHVRRAHDFCIATQERLAADLRPGSLPSRLAETAFAAASQAGWAEGFMALGGNKVRFLGHGIGLAVDEYPVLAKGFDRPLEAGMVLALEPKIGIPGLGMVGLENTFEVTPAGGRSITGERFAIICLGD